MNGANLERKFTEGFNTRQGVSVTVNIRVKGSNFASVFSGTNDAHIIHIVAYISFLIIFLKIETLIAKSTDDLALKQMQHPVRV